MTKKMKTVDLKNGLIAVVIGLVMVSCGGNSTKQQNAESSKQTASGISYELVKGGDNMFSAELFGLVEGKKYKIDLPAECISIVKQLDFDEDGLTDVLIENISACGGNGSANSFFFVYYKGNGFF